MRARRLKDNEIVDVIPYEKAENRNDVWIDGKFRMYLPSDLDFGVEEESEEVTTIDGWICRNSDGYLYLCGQRPTREYFDEIFDEGFWDDLDNSITLDSKLFPNITWRSEPEEVTLTIKAKKKKK